MATRVEDLLIQIRADNRQLLQALNQSSSATNSFAQQASRSGATTSSAFNAASSAVLRFAGPAVLGLALNKLYDLATASMEVADKIADTSAQLGLSTDAYQGLAFAAQQTGVDISTFEGAMRRLILTSGQAIDGNEKARESFSDLGISIQEVATLSPEQLFNRIANAVQGLSSQQEAAAQTAEIFGKEAVKMVTMLSGGADEITRLREQAEELGVVIDDDLIAKSAEMADQWEATKGIISANANALLLELAPAIVAVTSAMAKGAGVASQFFDRFRDVENISDGRLADELKRVNEQLEYQYSVLNRIGTKNPRSERLQELIKENEQRAIAIEREIELERIKKEQASKPGDPVAIKPTKKEQKEREKEDKFSVSPWVQDMWDRDEKRKRKDAEDQARDEMIRDGIEDTQKNNEQEIEKYADSMRYSIDELLQTQESSTERMLENWANMAEQMDVLWGDTIDGAASALTDFLFTGKTDFESFARSVIENLIKIQIQKALAGVLSSAGGGWGAVGSAIGGAFGLGRAGGGSVSPGVPYPVNERGQEIFVPSTAGKIVPNYAINGGGPTTVKVEVINKGTPQQATDAQASQTPKGMIATIVLEDVQRGGPISKGFQSAFGLKRNS